MQKKIFLQLFLLMCAVVISIFFFRTYFLNNDTKTIEIKKNNFDFENGSDSNLISSIKYVSKDKNGNIYQINSEYAEIKDDQLELVFMKNVVGVIRLNNSTPINISSERAIYNKITYDTNFYTNVLLTNDDHIITSDILDLFFGNNLATLTNNITYKNLNTTLQADKIEIDLITKNSKIFMKNKNKKVKIININ
jgi:hypothetical protein|tara:strand:+ start:68 stop:649 length:582 start_codon:yes stop_codon:yes gene_type:complete